MVKMSAFPELGRWIQYSWKNQTCVNSMGSERCRLAGFEDVGSFGRTELQAVIEYDGGDTDSQNESFFKMINWSYIPKPGKKELEVAVHKRNNELLGYACQTCKSTSSKLLRCKVCQKVRYCDRACQRKDWPSHQGVCFQENIVIQSNPRYPLVAVEKHLAVSQKKIQMDANVLLFDALNGKFEIMIDGNWVKDPKATDLQAASRYSLKYDSANDAIVHFKQRALESSEHTNGEPSSCGFFMTMEMCLEEKRYKEGGLHYLVVHDLDPGNFWGMVLNFKTFGTVAPFHTNCCCNFPEMPDSYKTMRDNWDKMFSRAKSNILDVQCMFADTTLGCHSYGLEGDVGCKFKHDVFVRVPRN